MALRIGHGHRPPGTVSCVSKHPGHGARKVEADCRHTISVSGMRCRCLRKEHWGVNSVTLGKMAIATSDIYELPKALEHPKCLPELCLHKTYHNLGGQNSYVSSWIYTGKLRQDFLESFGNQQ